MRLGRIEKGILQAIYEKPLFKKTRGYDPDINRDELPAILFGWKAWTSYTHKGDYYRYPSIPKREYQSGQATLTRALQSLYRKGLIDCGGWGEATSLKVYSERRAKEMSIEPDKPLSDAELDKWIYPRGGGRPWTQRKEGCDGEYCRNIKSIRLTETGWEKAEQLNVK